MGTLRCQGWGYCWAGNPIKFRFLLDSEVDNLEFRIEGPRVTIQGRIGQVAAGVIIIIAFLLPPDTYCGAAVDKSHRPTWDSLPCAALFLGWGAREIMTVAGAMPAGDGTLMQLIRVRGSRCCRKQVLGSNEWIVWRGTRTHQEIHTLLHPYIYTSSSIYISRVGEGTNE